MASHSPGNGHSVTMWPVALASPGFLASASLSAGSFFGPLAYIAVVALIGLNLAPTAVGSFESQPLIATVTLVSILLVTVVGPGLLGRLGILVGVVIGWVFAAVIGGLDSERVSALREADWFGLPSLHGPSFDWSVIVLALLVVGVLSLGLQATGARRIAAAPDQGGLQWVQATPRARDGALRSVRIGFRGPELAALEILDSLGQQSAIRFGRMDINPALPAETFQFRPPPGADVLRP